MNKFLNLILIFVMLFALSTAAAADDGAAPTNTLNWITGRRGLVKNEIDGGFYTVEDYDLDIWIPDFMTPQDEIPEDCYYIFSTEDGTGTAKVHRVGFEGDGSLEGIEKTVTDMGGESDGFYWINGYDALIYEIKASDAISVVIPFDEGQGLEFVFSPNSDPEFHSLFSMILYTIQPHRLGVVDVALMIDADLNFVWGPNKEVRYMDEPDNASITVFMWDEGVTSETIKNNSNWEAVREDKINAYNTYVDVLSEFGMIDDVLLTLKYISPDEDLSFLTISGGEVLYDVAEE